MELTAELFPFGVNHYNVLFDGDVIVEASRDPECDLARVLAASGYTGIVTMLDGDTGKPRTIINIQQTSRLTAEEGPNGPRFVRAFEFASCFVISARPMTNLGSAIPSGRTISSLTPC